MPQFPYVRIRGFDPYDWQLLVLSVCLKAECLKPSQSRSWHSWRRSLQIGRDGKHVPCNHNEERWKRGGYKMSESHSPYLMLRNNPWICCVSLTTAVFRKECFYKFGIGTNPLASYQYFKGERRNPPNVESFNLSDIIWHLLRTSVCRNKISCSPLFPIPSALSLLFFL